MNIPRLMAVEFFKLRKRMMTWVVALILVGLVVLLYSILWSVSGKVTSFGDNGQRFTGEQLRRALFLQTSVPFSLQIVQTFGMLLAVILASGAAGSEYSWGTVRLMATASSGRLRLIAAKLVVVYGMIAAGTVLAICVGVAYSAMITATSGGAEFDFVTASFIQDQVLSYLRTLFVMAPYVTLAFAAAIIGRSTLAGVGSGLGVVFLEPLVSGLMRLGGGTWRHVPNYLPSVNVQVVILQNRLPDVAKFGPSQRDLDRRGANSVEEAAIILAVYIIVFVAAAFIVYRRRDITAASGG